MLILFDIDGTLLLTGGIGRRSMQVAGEAFLGRPFNADGVDFSGRLDPLILEDLLVLNGVDPSPESVDQLRAHYIEVMSQAINSSGQVRALPGAATLVEEVGQPVGFTRGVLTGNYLETGTAKLQAAGWGDGCFQLSVWGDESPSRPHSRDQLPGVAISRYAQQLGTAAGGERVVILGDTVHDIACARAHGCSAIAVATGTYSVEQLGAAGADLVVETLEDTDRLVRWMVERAG